ncbi:MAG: hypothetical protein M1838_004627 [Thelocarpon superellum]|nr:MAG: hypothetical protein M1838_004627 [Thelocarpon superellum]
MASVPPQSHPPLPRSSSSSSSLPSQAQSAPSAPSSHTSGPEVSDPDGSTSAYSESASPPASSDPPSVFLTRSSSRTATAPSASHVTGPVARSDAGAKASEDTEDVRKCWICFTDETEDTPLSSEWRSPCPCALTAHESCLLDWIADLESPGPRKTRAGTAKILCPQCKSEIQVARPRSRVVEAMRALERTAGRLVLPGVFTVLGGCMWTGCLVYGINTVYIIFGRKHADLILGRAAHPWGTADDFWNFTTFVNPVITSAVGWSWRLPLGLPLIPAVLVLSRTKLADSVLPALPILFFATTGRERDRLDVTRWPPSPAVALSVLPYVRGAYNEAYERAFGARERRWIQEVQPRNEAAEAEGPDGQGPGPLWQGGVGGDEEGDVVVDVNMEIEIFDNDEPPAADDAGHAPDQVPLVNGEQNDGGAGAGAAAPPAPRANNLVFSANHLADTVLGALLFPSISATMGALLKLILPASWTTAPAAWDKSRPAGFLQARWGRSLVGGCLFVVLKDAVVLYCRWKQAQGHRHRRVLDYPGKVGTGKTRASGRQPD